MNSSLLTSHNEGIAVFGFPACGNTLVASVIYRLLLDKYGDVARTSTFHSKELLDDWARKSFPGARIDGPYFHQWGLCGFTAFFDHEFVSVLKLPTDIQKSGYLLHTHEKPCIDVLVQAEHAGYRNILVVRDPREALVSQAYKMSHYFTRLFATAGEDETENRERLAQKRLGDLEWFYDMASTLLQYLKVGIENRDKLKIIRYEDVLSRGAEGICALSSELGMRGSMTRSEYIWNETAYQPLVSKSHLFNPAITKWKSHLSLEHMGILKSLGMDQVLIDLGYDWSEPAGQKNATSNCAVTELDNLCLSAQDMLFHYDILKPLTWSHPTIKTSKLSCQLKGFSAESEIIAFSNNERLHDALKASLNDWPVVN